MRVILYMFGLTTLALYATSCVSTRQYYELKSKVAYNDERLDSTYAELERVKVFLYDLEQRFIQAETERLTVIENILNPKILGIEEYLNSQIIDTKGRISLLEGLLRRMGQGANIPVKTSEEEEEISKKKKTSY